MVRGVLTSLIYCYGENQELWKILTGDVFEKWLIIIEILSGFPLMFNVAYLYPMRDTVRLEDLAESWRLLYRLLEMLSFARFIRATKNSISMRALRMVIHNSAPHLLVSLVFFVGFICVSAIMLYFMEPCYDETICPWSDMFDSSWFSVVTMTTVGYGDMVPYYEHGRLFATIVMFFGTLFTSMPLAIIGNEYESIWDNLKREQNRENLHKKKMKVGKAIHKLNPDVIKRMQMSAKELHHNAIKSATHSGDHEILQVEGAAKGGNNVNERKVETSVSEVKTILMSAVKNVRSTAAKLKIIISYLKEKRKPGQKLGTVTGYRINNVTPEMLATAAQLREWLMLLQVSLKRSITLTEAACVDEDIVREMEKNVAITEREAFELLSGEMSTTIATEEEKKRNAKKARKKSKRMTEKNKLRRTHALRSQLQRQSFLTADDKFEEIRRSIELRKTKKNGKSSSKTLLPSLTMEIYRRLRRYHIMAWSQILSGGSNRVNPTADASKMKHLNEVEYVDEKGEVHEHKHHHGHHGDSYLERFHRAREAQIKEDPYTLRNRLYHPLIKPDSSDWAKAINNFMMVCVLLSLALLFCQSLTSYQTFGEGTSYCEHSVEIYCKDKTANFDPACFVQNPDYSGIQEPHTKLHFNCGGPQCYGVGANYGSDTSLMSCKYRSDSIFWEDDDFAASNIEQKNFRDRFDLAKEYGPSTVFTSRLDMQLRSDICGRIECRLDGEAQYNLDSLFLTAEIVLNAIFTVEVILRIYTTGHTVVYFLSDKSHIMDVLAVLPFYLVLALGGSVTQNLYLMPFVYGTGITLQYLRCLKIARLFRVVQHFRSSRSLFETGYKAGPQMATVLGCLLCIVIIFSLIFFEVEAGDACFISDEPGTGLNGEEMCGVDPDTGQVTIEGMHIGTRIVIDKNGGYSQFRDAFQCMWFCFVTITTVGYGDYFPVTKNGILLAIVLMVLGGMYMAIPFTAIGAIFYETHLKNAAEEQKKAKEALEEENMAQMIQKNEVERLHELTHIKSGQYICKLFADLYQRVDTMVHVLLQPREEITLEFEPDEQEPGHLRPVRKKMPSRSAQAFIETGDEGYRLLSRTAGVLFDLTIFADTKEKHYQESIHHFRTDKIQ